MPFELFFPSTCGASPTVNPSTSPIASPVDATTLSPVDAPTPSPVEATTPSPVEAVVDVKITEIMFNPSDCPDSEGEWIELYNAGSASVDLSGWSLKDNSGSISLSSDLVSGSYFIAARTTDGCGGLDANVTFDFALSNNGDTVELYDSDSNLHDAHIYASSDASAGYSIQLTADENWEQGVLGGSPRSGYSNDTSPVPKTTTPRNYQAYSLELLCGTDSGYATRFTYELVGPDSGNFARPSSFYYDNGLPQGCQQTSRSSYSHPDCGSSGRQTNPFCYDRGHLVMANHLDNNETSIYESNMMTNILPQAAGFNQAGGAWILTEEIIECGRDIPDVERQVIFGGALFSDSSNDYFLESHGIPTPETFWKVIVRYDSTGGTPDAIGWIMPNEYTSTEDKLDTYLYSVAQIQALTGDAMHELPDSYTELAFNSGVSWTKPSDCDLSR